MIPSKAKRIISSKIKKIGSQYTSGSSTFYGRFMKSNISQDLPRSDHVVYAAWNASIEDGQIVSKDSDYYVPLQINIPNLVEGDVYKKLFMLNANASGDLAHYDYPLVASFDEWDVATGSTGFITKKTSVKVNFERISLRAENTDEIGQVEAGDFMVTMPWSVNASFTPVAECRFTDRQGRKWRIEDVDDKTYFNQAYQMRVSADDR